SRFIRLQLQLAELPDGIDHPDWPRLFEESHELVSRNYAAWLRSYDGIGILDAEYDRGFIEYVVLRAPDLLNSETRTRLFRLLPVRHLDIVDREGEPFGAVLRLPEMTGIVSLGLDRLELEERT